MPDRQSGKNRERKPRWLKRRLPDGPSYERVRALLNKSRLNTVCQEARCPNIWECFSKQTSTFLILGSCCTRNCRFCAIEHGDPSPPDLKEPARVAETVEILGLSYVVITSVTRDDLPDGGAGHFAKTIREIRKRMPNVLVEVLIPDFQGDAVALKTVLAASPSVVNHNIETIPRFYPLVRSEAVYARSIELLRQAKQYNPDILTKSGLMLGLGESANEVEETMLDIRKAGCGILTLGQYLQPTKGHLPVDRFIPPEEFDNWRKAALDMGFSDAACGPFVRSSYHAKELYHGSSIS
ncbi:lipoyl synthase [bacterium]|nr:lipoyl synthase [bacterium]